MVRFTLPFKKTLTAALLTGLVCMSGCTSNSKDRSPDWAENSAIIEKTEELTSMKPGSDIEREAFQRFNRFYADYSVETIRSGIREVYADNAWFGDPFHIVEGIDDIERYFTVMAEPVISCSFKVDSMQRSGKDYFARWTMTLESSAAKGEVIKTIGISHIRFNEGGKVIFQQDYWDTSAMLDRLPIVGYWTRLVKSRVEKGLKK